MGKRGKRMSTSPFFDVKGTTCEHGKKFARIYLSDKYLVPSLVWKGLI